VLEAVANICFLIFKISELLLDFEGYVDKGSFMSGVFVGLFQGFIFEEILKASRVLKAFH
jgi:hypothetical protein